MTAAPARAGAREPEGLVKGEGEAGGAPQASEETR